MAAVLVGIAVLSVNADTTPDPATGDFWYLDGRAGYPGAAAAAVVTVEAAVVPQVAGAPAFDSGVGDLFSVVYEAEFLSIPLGLYLLVW